MWIYVPEKGLAVNLDYGRVFFKQEKNEHVLKVAVGKEVILAEQQSVRVVRDVEIPGMLMTLLGNYVELYRGTKEECEKYYNDILSAEAMGKRVYVFSSGK